jgi:hypothetical protein
LAQSVHLRLAATIAVAVVISGFVGAPSATLACSICRCGDPTFNALGKAGFTTLGFRAALDWERFDKDEGNPAEESESQVENRITGLVSYGFGEHFMLNARVPLSIRHLEMSAPGEPTHSVDTTGLSDPEVYGQLRLWASPMKAPVGRQSSLSLLAGVKTPWGENDVREAGVRVDEHAQPGTGSTDLFGSLAFLYLVGSKNDLGYRYGSSVTANVAYEHKLGGRLDGVLELNFRHASQDQVDAAGSLDEDTGGSLLYVTPRLLVNLGGGLVLRASAQIPTLKDLNGFQTERAVANVGVTYLFNH